MNARILLTFAVALLSLPLAGQQATVSETVEVRLLEVDVVVTDKLGGPVHGLTAADFELFESGRPQPITNLSEYREEQATPASTPPPPSDAPIATPVARPKPRTLVLLLDPLPIRGPKRLEFFGTLRSLAQRTLRPGDRIQILSWTGSGFRTTLDMTSNRDAALDVLTTLGQNPTPTMPDGPSIDQKEIFLRGLAKMTGTEFNPEEIEIEKRNSAEEDLAIMRRKTASMQRMVSSLTSAAAKTIVIYASDDFSRVAGKRAFVGTRAAGGPPSIDEEVYDTTRMIEAVVATANANGVSFYAIHPVIPSTFGEFRTREEEMLMADQITAGTEAITDQLVLQNEIDALRHLAEETGGTLGVGPAGVTDVADRIAADLGSYYSLGWHARDDGGDRERRVRVRAKNRDYTVRTRSALVEKSDRTRADDLLIARLFEGGTAGDVDFEIKTGTPQTSRGARTSIPVELTIPADQLRFVVEGAENVARFTVLTIAGTSIGETTKITHDTRRVTAPKLDEATDGLIHYRMHLLADLRKTAVSVGVLDENSGLAGVRKIDLNLGQAQVAAVETPVGDAIWRDAYERSLRGRQPLVVFFRPKRCKPCDAFERDSIRHPAIARRLPQVTFTTIAISPGTKSPYWASPEAGIAVFDETATLRARWIGIPDTTQLGAIFDASLSSAANFQRAAATMTREGPYAGAQETAIGLVKLGRAADARAVLDEAVDKGDPAAKQLAAIARATLDAREGCIDEALATLLRISSEAKSSRIAGEAWLAAGTLHRVGGRNDAAAQAYRSAAAFAEAGSPMYVEATTRLAEIEASMKTAGGPIRLVPFPSQIVTGERTVRTVVSSPAVARVVFSVDGQDAATVTAPPFSAELALGTMPEARTIRAVAFDPTGVEVGRHELTVNDGGEVFWLRVTEPTAGAASGRTNVAMTLRAPTAREVKKVTLSWNDKPAVTLTRAPWTATIDIPSEVGVFRAVAELDDGRTAEDAVILNTKGYVERAEVQMVELPVTVTPIGTFSAADVEVSEGRAKRSVESVTMGADAPLTVGILIDSSASMQKRLPDVQEAAIRFIDAGLVRSDRAFLIAFDSTARLLEPPTSDRSALRRSIMTLAPNGLTALNDAMILGLLQFEGVKGRRALVVFTDGLDTMSRYTADDLKALARRSNVPIYLITPPLQTITSVNTPVATPGRSTLPQGSIGVHTRLAPDAARLVEVARASGGRLHEFRELGDVGAIYGSIADALRAQALVTIRTSPAAKENEWRSIEVELKGREVRAPAGYYAPR